MSLEKCVATYLHKNNHDYFDNCNSTSESDFWVVLDKEVDGYFSFDVKEKKCRYKGHWTDKIPEDSLFIIDDISARRLFMDAPYSAIVVYDQTSRLFHVFTALTMFLMPKTRANREVSGVGLRGKWIVDFRNSCCLNSFEEVMEFLKKYVKFCKSGMITDSYECLGKYYGEDIIIKGTKRTVEQRKHDFNSK